METPQPPVFPVISTPQAKMSALAVISLVTGILACCLSFVGGAIPYAITIIGLITGVVAVVLITRSNKRMKGLSIAIAGTSLVALAIIIRILIVLAMLQSEVAKEKASEKTSISNVRSLVLSIAFYWNEHDEMLPPMANIDELHGAMLIYIAADQIWTSPLTGSPYAVNPNLSNKKMSDDFPRATTIAVYEPTSTHGRRVVGFLDGHVLVITDAEWPAVKTASGLP